MLLIFSPLRNFTLVTQISSPHHPTVSFNIIADNFFDIRDHSFLHIFYFALLYSGNPHVGCHVSQTIITWMFFDQQAHRCQSWPLHLKVMASPSAISIPSHTPHPVPCPSEFEIFSRLSPLLCLPLFLSPSGFSCYLFDWPDKHHGHPFLILSPLSLVTKNPLTHLTLPLQLFCQSPELAKSNHMFSLFLWSHCQVILEKVEKLPVGSTTNLWYLISVGLLGLFRNPFIHSEFSKFFQISSVLFKPLSPSLSLPVSKWPHLLLLGGWGHSTHAF